MEDKEVGSKVKVVDMDPVLSTAIEYSEYRLPGRVTCTVSSCKKKQFL